MQNNMAANQASATHGVATDPPRLDLSLRIVPHHMLMGPDTRAILAAPALTLEVDDSIGVIDETPDGPYMREYAHGWKSILLRQLRSSVEDIHGGLGGGYYCPGHTMLLRAIDDLFPKINDLNVYFFLPDDELRLNAEQLRTVLNQLAPGEVTLGVYLPQLAGPVTHWLAHLSASGFITFPEPDVFDGVAPRSTNSGHMSAGRAQFSHPTEISGLPAPPAAGASLDAGRISRSPDEPPVIAVSPGAADVLGTDAPVTNDADSSIWRPSIGRPGLPSNKPAAVTPTDPDAESPDERPPDPFTTRPNSSGSVRFSTDSPEFVRVSSASPVQRFADVFGRSAGHLLDGFATARRHAADGLSAARAGFQSVRAGSVPDHPTRRRATSSDRSSRPRVSKRRTSSTPRLEVLQPHNDRHHTASRSLFPDREETIVFDRDSDAEPADEFDRQAASLDDEIAIELERLSGCYPRSRTQSAAPAVLTFPGVRGQPGRTLVRPTPSSRLSNGNAQAFLADATPVGRRLWNGLRFGSGGDDGSGRGRGSASRGFHPDGYGGDGGAGGGTTAVMLPTAAAAITAAAAAAAAAAALAECLTPSRAVLLAIPVLLRPSSTWPIPFIRSNT